MRITHVDTTREPAVVRAEMTGEEYTYLLALVTNDRTRIAREKADLRTRVLRRGADRAQLVQDLDERGTRAYRVVFGLLARNGDEPQEFRDALDVILGPVEAEGLTAV